MTVQGMGIQQHEYSPQSIHLVFPAPSPLTIAETVEEAAEPGPLRLTRDVVVEVHILFCCLLF